MRLFDLVESGDAWWCRKPSPRRWIAHLEQQLELAHASKITAILRIIEFEQKVERLEAGRADDAALIAGLRAQLEPFTTRTRHPRDGKFVKIRRARDAA